MPVPKENNTMQKNKILIAVPSKGRWEVLERLTMQWLHLTKYDFKVFVEPKEYHLYQSVMQLHPSHIEVLPENNRGLNYALDQVKIYAEKNGYTVIFKVDDDVKGWVGRSRRSSFAKNLSVFEEAIEDGLKAFDEHADDGLGAIGFPYRNEMWEVKLWTAINARLQTCYMIRTDLMYSSGQLGVFVDLAKFVWLRVNNYHTLRYGLAGIDCLPVGGGEGGHQSFDRDEGQARREVDELGKIYSALKAKQVDKPWKLEPDLSGPMFSTKKL